jgi:hypothetical protein
MSKILGLDISTSITGVAIVDSDVEIDDKGSHILLLEAIEFKKCKTLWEKADVVQEYFNVLSSKFSFLPDRILVEEPLMSFRPGMSSAQTISSLIRFNGIVSFLARSVLRQEPEFVSAAHARKLCGIKLQKTGVAGPQKAQVFKHMSENDLKHVVWPLKKSGKIVDWASDATDAYVIACSGIKE